MHSIYSRLNAIFAYATFVIFCLLAVNAVSRFFFITNPQATVSLNAIPKFGRAAYQGFEQADIVFDLDADLTSLFHWNTKQLFVFVTVEFATEKNKLNQVVIWDRIIEKKEDALLKLTAEPSEYRLADQGLELRNNNMTLSFHWDVTPVAGLILPGQLGVSSFKVPAEYYQ